MKHRSYQLDPKYLLSCSVFVFCQLLSVDTFLSFDGFIVPETDMEKPPTEHFNLSTAADITVFFQCIYDLISSIDLVYPVLFAYLVFV